MIRLFGVYFFSRARSSEKGNDQITPFFFKELTLQ